MEPPAGGAAESSANYERRIRGQICTFPNRLHNSWMNATLQAVLNLRVVGEKLRPQPVAPLAQLSVMPSFSRLFMRALKEPRKKIKYVYGPLKELGRVLPGITAFQENDPLHLVGPLLMWLGGCGLETSITESKVVTCSSCDSSSISSQGRVVHFLPAPCTDRESVSSLLAPAFSKKLCRRRCSECDSEKEKAFFWNSPDVLAVSRTPRAADASDGARHPVAPNVLLKIGVEANQSQVYQLSSVICYSAANAHYWARLFRDQRTIEVDDRRVRVVPCDELQNLADEEIFFYEKMRVPAR